MKSFSVAALGVCLVLSGSCFADPIRPPSVPLILHDPYFSIWSPGDTLTDVDTTHWTGAQQAISGIAWVDGKPHQFLGKPRRDRARMKQTGLKVWATRTVATFEGAGIGMTLTFVTPALPGDLDRMSRPLTYVVTSAQSVDGREHQVEFDFSFSGTIATNTPSQLVRFVRPAVNGLRVGALESTQQNVLGTKGDSVRIDWGRFLVAGHPSQLGGTVAPGAGMSVTSELPASDSSANIRLRPVLAGPHAEERWFMVAYDDETSLEYFGQWLRPYWRRKGMDAARLLLAGASEYSDQRAKCEAFDKELWSDLQIKGGEKYAALASLAYRQCLAGAKLVADPNGQPLLFPKENTSNGCIATSDVIYPMSPQILMLGSSITRALLVPIMEYAASNRWKFDFAPHDLGTYPKANGQVYGGGERTEENQMPVEESANMLILVAALAQMEGSADFASGYWSELSRWAAYLKNKGFDPENQLCTDDFLGHQAHNVNLSAKAILGLASFGRLCELRGLKNEAHEYLSVAHGFAQRWVKESDDGGHSRLTFDRPGTWSQKYNLVWDKILGFGLFADSVRTAEMANYRRQINAYGLPLDSRGSGAKLDWSLWTATLTQNADDFRAVVEPVYRFVDESPERVGMGDWYNTENGNFNFMHSRPVVGGVFLQVLYDPVLWRKYAARDKSRAGGWAVVPPAPMIETVVPAGDTTAATWRYTTDAPASLWATQGFDDTGWNSGESGFGVPDTPGVSVRTRWDTKDIWIRRRVELTASQLDGLMLWLHHDDAAEIYINGVLAAEFVGWTSQYEPFALSSSARRLLRAGSNVIAIHCHQDSGGQYIDCGLVRIKR